MFKNYYRVWYTEGKERKFIIVNADTGKEAKLKVKKLLKTSKIGTAWKITI